MLLFLILLGVHIVFRNSLYKMTDTPWGYRCGCCCRLCCIFVFFLLLWLFLLLLIQLYLSCGQWMFSFCGGGPGAWSFLCKTQLQLRLSWVLTTKLVMLAILILFIVVKGKNHAKLAKLSQAQYSWPVFILVLLVWRGSPYIYSLLPSCYLPMTSCYMLLSTCTLVLGLVLTSW